MFPEPASPPIIPAATARPFAPTPEQMALGASGVGALAAQGGPAASLTWDTPAGPSIVVAATVLFAVGLVVGSWCGGGWDEVSELGCVPHRDLGLGSNACPPKSLGESERTYHSSLQRSACRLNMDVLHSMPRDQFRPRNRCDDNELPQ